MGAAVSVMSEESFKSPRDIGTVSHAMLFTYTGERVPVVGAADVEVLSAQKGSISDYLQCSKVPSVHL